MNRRQFLRRGTRISVALALPLPVSRALFAAGLPAGLIDFDAIELSMAIREKQTSCHEVMQAYLSHIHACNPAYNAIVGMVDDDELLRQAREADQALARGEYRGWMHGMPHAIKDLTPAAGLPYTSGSPLFADRIADSDSDLAARIRAAGAIFIGKTNTPEFGLGSQSYNPVYGATGSAWDPTLTSGGSSGGAGSGLGTHMLPVADGSDMMGSLRNPAAFNNVIGFRPSTNVMDGGAGSERGLSTSGPMGRNTADTIRLLQSIAVRPVGDTFAPSELRGTRVAWMGNFDNYLAMERGIVELCDSTLASLADAGVTVEAVQPRFDLSELWYCWTTLRHSGRIAMKPWYDDPETRPLLKPELVWEIEQAMGLDDADRQRANRIRVDWYRELDRLFTSHDFLALPTAQVFPWSREVHWPRQINGRQMDTYHRWMEVVIAASLGGIPVINLPAGFDERDRPMGMQFMANFGEDRKVLEFGLAFEEVIGHLQRRPTLVTA